MYNKPGTQTTTRTRLQALIDRRVAIDAAVRAEKEKRRAAETKRQEKLDHLIGHALRKQGARDPDFQVALQTLIERAIDTLDEGDRTFLKANYNS